VVCQGYFSYQLTITLHSYSYPLAEIHILPPWHSYFRIQQSRLLLDSPFVTPLLMEPLWVDSLKCRQPPSSGWAQRYWFIFQ